MNNKYKALAITPLLLFLVGIASLSYVSATANTTIAVVIDKSFVNANDTMLQYRYTIVYQNTAIPSYTHTEFSNIIINQTLPTNAAGFSNSVIAAIQNHAAKLPQPIAIPSTGNVIIPP